MQQHSKVAVVILNYNGRDYLKKFIPLAVAFATPDTRIYVADNASTDDSIAFLKKEFPQVHLIELTENYGFAEGYNQALKQVQAPYYVLLNSDVEVTPNWIAPIINLMDSDDTIAACQPKVLAHYNKALFEHAGGAGGWMDNLGYPFCRGRIFSHLETDEGQYDDNCEIFWATGAALFIKSDIYHQFEGLDGDYFAHMEEIDLCWRLKRAGYKIMVCPESVVYHVGGGTLPPSSPRKTYLNFRNNLVTLMKNEPSYKLYWLIPLRFILDGVAAFLFLTEGKFKEIGAILSAHGYFYKNFTTILKKRKYVNQLIEREKINSPNYSGVYTKSIVIAYYLKKIKEFRKLK